MKSLRQMLKFLEHHRRESILAPLLKMLEALLDLLIPLLTADVINTGIAARDTDYILGRCALMVLLGAVGLTCSITAQYFSAKAAVGACAEIRHALFDKTQSLDFSQMDALGSGTLITRMTSDVNQVQNGLNLFLRLLLRSPFVIVGAMLLAFSINGKAALVFVVIIPAIAAVLYAIMHKTIPLYRGVQTRLDKITGIVRENLSGVRVVRAFGREHDETARFEAADEALTESQLGVGRISALLNPLSYALINIAIAALLAAGSFGINAGELTVGGLVALLNYMNQILLELIKTANLIVQLTKATACTGRIRDVLAVEPQMRFGSRKVDASACENALAFRHVSLRYDGAGADSLSDISFTVKRGQTIGVIGGTGSGKTSLVSLLPRSYDATAGTVELFGHDIREYDRQSLRNSVSTVQQTARLFSGSIRSNLLWGNAEADDAALLRALETAQAAEIIRGRPEGLDAPVEQGGRNFSGGQKQRLSIARALLSDPEILILDDAASALDYATDAALRRALAALHGTKTLFIVSQRANSICHADRILVLDEGRLVGIGRHKELLQNCPVYRDICDSQFGKAGESA